MRAALPICLLTMACGASPPRAAAWPLPEGWKRETIAFPLDFAPALAHRGFEELRFAPGMFDPIAPGYWSYAFVWRTDDPAELDAAALAAELTLYFKGLIAAVDTEQRITDRDAIAVRAEPDGAGFRLAAHVFDAFETAQPVALLGSARRTPCERGGALWVFVLAPARSGVRATLDELGAAATCEIARAR
jgi:hypothetical protein